MAERRRYWILAYDIHCPKRLGRLCRFMKDYGLHVQKSVFFLCLRTHEVDELGARIETMIEPAEDDVRIYGCRSPERAIMLGVGYLDGSLLGVGSLPSPENPGNGQVLSK